MNQILSFNNEPDENQKKNRNTKNNQFNISQETQRFSPYQSPYKSSYKSTKRQSKTSNRNSYNETIRRANATSNKADISKVILVFCIIIILFGLFLIGESTYAMVTSRKKDADNPQVYPLQMGKETKITVETEHPIKEFSYKWNEGEPVTIPGNGTVLFETIIQIPNGNNILYMTVTDYNGNKQNFNRQYIYDSSDTNKPTIDISASGGKLKITAVDDIEMSYITYSWNDDEATRVEVDADDKLTITANIDVPKGQNKLSIIAVDKQGNRETVIKNKIVGDTKPSFELLKDGQNIIIKASDDEGVSKIVMDVDGEKIESDSINLREVTASVPVQSGTHTISVTVTNVNGLSDTKTVTVEI